MRKILMLGCGLAGSFALLGGLFDARLFVLAAYIAVLFIPILVVGGLYNYFNSRGKSWPDSCDRCGQWPPELRKRGPSSDPMW